ncbi:hypothetical protein OCO53_25605 [Peribacillus frigoritolerans]|uniref:hypothetical protein n=1 Tax=Peribacillus frigoritolerans TaxID=450367 RepID=UPI0021D3A4D9|nr:hypothetical protein [Peribacillus frigoritolerans]MCU6603820.1 hypothetical protein [Peribacillus frigoritolerans]
MLVAKELLRFFGFLSLVATLTVGFFFLFMKIDNHILKVISIFGFAILMKYVPSLLRK